MDLRKAFQRGGVRGELTGYEATAEEVEKLAEELCGLVDQGKYDKACRQLVAWLNDAALSGAALLTTYLAIGVAQACVDRGVPVDGLERRVPQFSGAPQLDAVRATLHAQGLIMAMLERAARGGNEQPTLDELTAIWENAQFGTLVVYYYLQCLANAAHLDRVTDVLYVSEAAADRADAGDQDAVPPRDNGHVQGPQDAADR